MTRLTYRGTTFNYKPAKPSTTVVSVPLTYRGVRHELVSPIAPVLPHTLKYRGVAYHVGQNSQSSQPNVARVAPQSKVAHVHRQNLLSNLQHRIEIAQARGDEQLLALLAAEREQLTV